MPADDAAVSFGRWEEAHKALADRVRECELDIDQIKKDIIVTAQRRMNRQWQIALALLTAFLLPLILYIITLTSHTLGH